jgi:tetratricopeptide (TPR) repeat protein
MSFPEIENALARFREHLSTRQPHDYPSTAFVLSKESLGLQLRFMHTRDDADLRSAVEKSDAAICEITSDTQACDKNVVYESVSNGRYLQFRNTGLLNDINTAIEYCAAAMDNVIPRTQRWWALAIKLGILMLDRLELSFTREYIEETVGFYRRHVTAEGLNPSARPMFLSQFSVALKNQYLLTHDDGVMEEALGLGYQSISLLGPDPEFATMEYTNLAGNLLLQFQQTLRSDVLEEALQMSRSAIKYEPKRGDKAEMAGRLVSYGVVLENKWRRYRDTDRGAARDALSKATEAGRDAVRLLRLIGRQSGEFEMNQKAQLLTIISPWFTINMELTGDLRSGEEGVALLLEALELRQQNHPARRHILTRLSHTLDTQHRVLKDQNDTRAVLCKLNKALAYGTEAAELTPDLDPDRGERYMNLGKMHLSKWLLTNDEELLPRAMKHFDYVANLGSAPTVLRVPAAIQGAHLHLRYGEAAQAHQLLQTGISLLPVFHLESLSSEDLRATLTQVSGLSTLAASVALEAGQDPFVALQSLEAGRCIISGLAMSLKTEVARLRQRDRKLAQAYEDLRRKLAGATQQPSNAPGASQPVWARQKVLLQELAAMEAEIRRLDGFETFQLPVPEEKVRELAGQGPLVAINVTHLRSDAIIITVQRIRVVKLTELRHSDLVEKIGIFENLGNESRRNAVVMVPRQKEPEACGAEALRWLWDVAVRPILDELEADLAPSRRVWWITSGFAGRVPLHAAGTHDEGSVENTLSRVVSSYVSSVKALHYAREEALSSQPASAAGKSMLLVTMQRSPWPHRHLVTIHEERAIRSVFGQDMVHLDHPDPALVLENIPFHSFIHFACHGASISSDPSQSGLLLVRDERAAMLTVSQLERVDTGRGAVAYLSACSTAQQPDGKLADEAIHLANTFQALGFQHVVGTMWGAKDSAAGEVAKRFYAKLTPEDGVGLGHIGVATALHEAMLEYREVTAGEGKDMLAWSPFIHIGV